LEVLGGSLKLHGAPKNSTNRSDNTPSPDSAPRKINIYRRKNGSICGKPGYFLTAGGGSYLQEQAVVREHKAKRGKSPGPTHIKPAVI
jgi:hypothetical protein